MNIEKINEIIKIIRISSVTEQKKDELTLELLNMLAEDRERRNKYGEETEEKQKGIEQKKIERQFA